MKFLIFKPGTEEVELEEGSTLRSAADFPTNTIIHLPNDHPHYQNCWVIARRETGHSKQYWSLTTYVPSNNQKLQILLLLS